MRQRSLNTRYLVAGVALFVGTLALFTKILAPLERVVLNIAGSALLGYSNIPTQALTGSATNDQLENHEARIIGKHADEFQETLLINTAGPEGTRILSGDVLVGVISSGSSAFSKVEMITSPLNKIDGVFGRSGIPAIFEGKGAGILETRLPRGSDVALGDIAYHDEGIKLRIGTAVKVQDIPSSPFITIWIRHPVNTVTLQKVELLR